MTLWRSPLEFAQLPTRNVDGRYRSFPTVIIHASGPTDLLRDLDNHAIDGRRAVVTSNDVEADGLVTLLHGAIRLDAYARAVVGGASTKDGGGK